MLLAQVTSANTPDHTALIVAVCAVCNILIAVSQALVIPFVRAVRADVKEICSQLASQQLSLVRIETEMETYSKGFSHVNERHNLLQKRNDSLTLKLNHLMMSLAHKQIYNPNQQFGEEDS